MGRFLMFLAYNGSKYSGIQVQRVAGQQHPHFKTVQGVMEKLLDAMNPGHETRLSTSSRTDTGVHALCNSVHFDYQYSEDSEKHIDPDRLAHRLNHRLQKAKEDIRVVSIQQVNDNFHCRYQAIKRSYVYRLAVSRTIGYPDNQPVSILELRCSHKVPQPFDTDLFLRSVEMFAGTHNFRAFTTEASLKKEAKDTVRRLHIGVKKGQSLHNRLDNRTPVDCDYWDVHMESYSFLYHQVRRIVGALVEVGLGRLSTDDVHRVLEDPQYKNQLPGHLLKAAVPHGLYLKNVHYDPKDLVYTPCEVTAAESCSELSNHGDGLRTLCDEPPTETDCEPSAMGDDSDCEHSINMSDSRHMNNSHEHDNKNKYVQDLIQPRVKT